MHVGVDDEGDKVVVDLGRSLMATTVNVLEQPEWRGTHEAGMDY